MNVQIRETRSVCPVCLKNLPAVLVQAEGGQVFLEKRCAEHGAFRVPVWRGHLDFIKWTAGSEELSADAGHLCPEQCGLCPEHETGTCCILLEVTNRCNLRCRFCFANGGGSDKEPSLEMLKAAILDITEKCGSPLLQLSGGEPTLREDLPELVRFAKEAGCSFVQINTNGIRIAEDSDYARRLAEAGLDIVFLQFDGTTDEIFQKLRGVPLLKTKQEAVRICSALKIGVTLVPTVVRGVNDRDLGNLVAYAAAGAPGIRGIHFQPVSYFGRYPDIPGENGRYTMDELMANLAVQADIPMESFLPSRCDHPLCGFHSRFLVSPEGGLEPLTSFSQTRQGRSSARENREYVARHWTRETGETGTVPVSGGNDFDTFLHRLRTGSLTLSAMAFQDAENLNIERLHRCSLHVYDRGKITPFCARYLTAFPEQEQN